MPSYGIGPLDKPCSRSLPFAIGVMLAFYAWDAWSEQNMPVAAPVAFLSAVEFAAAWVLAFRRGRLALWVAVVHGVLVGIGLLITTMWIGSSLGVAYIVLFISIIGLVTVEVGQDSWKLLHLRQTTDGVLTEPPQPFRIAGIARICLLVFAGLAVATTFVQRTREPDVIATVHEGPKVTEQVLINFKKISLLSEMTPKERLGLLTEIQQYHEERAEMDSLAVYT